MKSDFFLKKNNRILVQLAILLGGVALFFGVLYVCGNPQEASPVVDAAVFEEEDNILSGDVVSEKSFDAGIALLCNAQNQLFAQNDTGITEAERIFGANVEVITESQKQWRKMQEEVGNVAVTTAGNYVNIREDATAASTLIGKAYTGAVVNVVDSVTDDEGALWYHITSGEVDGYASAAFFLTGEPLVTELSDEEEYLSEKYITNKDDWKLAITLEEEARIREEEEDRLREQQQQDSKTIENNRIKALEASQIISEEAKEAARNGDTSLLRAQMIEYAKQFLGNRYINGGRSLVDGTDCSGFTCYIYRDFGYSIDRTPAAQYQNAGRSITLEEARPGDIVCYGKTSVTHVALYMGNGKIIHSANSRKGVVIYDVGYDTIIGVKSVMD